MQWGPMNQEGKKKPLRRNAKVISTSLP